MIYRSLLLVVVVLLLAAVAVVSTSREAEPAELTIVASRATTEVTAWAQQSVPDLGANFGRLVDAMRPKPKPKARTAPTRRGLFVAAYASEVVTLIREGFARFGPNVAEQAVRVSACETGGTFDPTVVNASGHYGLFQLARRYHEARAASLGYQWAQMREARPNIAVAASLYGETHSWRAWTCRYAA